MGRRGRENEDELRTRQGICGMRLMKRKKLQKQPRMRHARRDLEARSCVSDLLESDTRSIVHFVHRIHQCRQYFALQRPNERTLPPTILSPVVCIHRISLISTSAVLRVHKTPRVFQFAKAFCYSCNYPFQIRFLFASRTCLFLLRLFSSSGNMIIKGQHHSKRQVCHGASPEQSLCTHLDLHSSADQRPQ